MNGYSCFVSQLQQTGQLPKSKSAAIEMASPIWQNMTTNEKDLWKDRAKRSKSLDRASMSPEKSSYRTLRKSNLKVKQKLEKFEKLKQSGYFDSPPKDPIQHSVISKAESECEVVEVKKTLSTGKLESIQYERTLFTSFNRTGLPPLPSRGITKTAIILNGFTWNGQDDLEACIGNYLISHNFQETEQNEWDSLDENGGIMRPRRAKAALICNIFAALESHNKFYKQFDRTVGSDALMTKKQQSQVGSDALMNKKEHSEVGSDALMNKKEHSEVGSDALMNKKEHSEVGSDALMNKKEHSEVGSDALMNKKEHSEVGSDALMNKKEHSEVGSDALMNKKEHSEVGSDALMNKKEPSEVGSDALMTKKQQSQAGCDVLMKKKEQTLLSEISSQATVTLSQQKLQSDKIMQENTAFNSDEISCEMNLSLDDQDTDFIEPKKRGFGRGKPF